MRWRSAWGPTRRPGARLRTWTPKTRNCGRRWNRWAEEDSDVGNRRPDAGVGSRRLRARSDAAADSASRAGISDLLAETAGGDRLRGMGRGRQGRGDQADHREIDRKSTRL